METLLSIIAIVISVLSSIYSLYTFFWTVRRDRKKATFEEFSRLQNDVFDNLNLITKSAAKDIASDSKSSEFREYSRYLFRIEHFCIGVQSNIFDYETTLKIASKYLIDTYKKSLPIIVKRREIYPDEPQCEEFMNLVERLQIDLCYK